MKAAATADSQAGCPRESTNYLIESSTAVNPGRVVCFDAGA